MNVVSKEAKTKEEALAQVLSVLNAKEEEIVYSFTKL